MKSVKSIEKQSNPRHTGGGSNTKGELIQPTAYNNKKTSNNKKNYHRVAL